MKQVSIADLCTSFIEITNEGKSNHSTETNISTIAYIY